MPSAGVPTRASRSRRRPWHTRSQSGESPIAHASTGSSPSATWLAGHIGPATAATREALELARRHGERGNEAEALRVLGEVTAGAGGDMAEAAAHLLEALALAGALHTRPLAAHCHLGLGKLYRRIGKRQEAQEHLTTATTMYREMDMRFWLDQAEAEMRGRAAWSSDVLKDRLLLGWLRCRRRGWHGCPVRAGTGLTPVIPLG